MASEIVESLPETNNDIPSLREGTVKIRRDYDAKWLNAIVNHPEVYPWVRGVLEGEIDLTAQVQNPANILISGEYGAVLFVQLQQGLYEAHSQAIPEGRGQWMVNFVNEAIKFMFTRTDCFELLTKCPHGNLGARALAKCVGGKRLFTNPTGWVRDNKTIPADIFGITIQDWMLTAKGLEERGHWFHERLMQEYARLGRKEAPHPDDDTHDRYVGMACEMFLGGQPEKAVILYCRWAAMAGYAPIHLVSRNPIAVDIHDAIIVVKNNDFYVSALTRGDEDVH